ncbi:MAG: RluA family pseudouridine synthase [Clostridiales bacterium]|nr:RluA family pseudouridine synthase [Clostridiales bacterium]
METKTIDVKDLLLGKRVDVYLSEVLDFTRSHIKKMCDEGNLLVNGLPSKSNKIIKNGDVITLSVPENKCLDVVPEDIPLNIIYQDDDLAVIDKPQGLTVHAGNGTHGSTLVNALLFHLDKLSGINGVIRPGIVHRIDKNTSGLLVVAKNDKSHVALAKQLEDKTCKRIYVALLEGNLKNDSGRVATDIGRNPNDRTKMAVVERGKNAVTDYKVLKRYEGYTLCEFSLKTGRTHQIRVHAKYLGHPVVGDKEYGYKNQKFKLEGQLLHAKTLTFIHPSTNKAVTFESNIPAHFQSVLNKLKEI